MKMPEGFERLDRDLHQVKDRLPNGGYSIPTYAYESLEALKLMKEMAEALEALTTDLDLLCEDASGNIERASEVIKKFQEWE